MKIKKELFIILLVKIAFTLLTFYFLQKMSNFSDTERYLNSHLSFNNILDRTTITENLFSLLMSIFVEKLAVNLFVSISFGFILYLVFKDRFEYVDKKLFWLVFLLPNFQIWTGIAGKEILAISGYLLLIRWIVDFQLNRKCNILYLLIGLGMGVLLRPHYGIAYLVLLFSSIFLVRVKIRNFSNITYYLIIIFVIAFTSILLYFTNSIWGKYFLSAMLTIKSYFTYPEANSSRYWIVWAQLSDYFYNMYWGLFYSIVGPTLTEAINRVIFIPVFIEGIIGFLLIFIIFYKLKTSVKHYPPYANLFYFSFVPSFIIILLINYPFCIFNPGSAVRYKQNITPLIYIYPLLILSYIKELANNK
ncbi:hypothetical protein ACSIZT_002074 [Yersinia enterocolitica]